MTEFELLAIPISLVLGLGITQILGGVTSAVRSREESPAHWLPFGWAFLIFLFQVEYFFVLWDLNDGRSWTWSWYGPALFHTVLLFLGAGLILPAYRERRTSLIDDFDKHGRLALVPLGMALAVAVPLNVYQHGNPWTQTANLLNVALTALIIMTMLTRNRKVQGAAALTFGALQIYGMLFVWSRPGN